MEELTDFERESSGATGQIIHSRNLDTNGCCCFLCQKILEFKTDDDGDDDNEDTDRRGEGGEEEEKKSEEMQSVSLKSLRRYLKIDADKLPAGIPTTTSSVASLKKKEEDINKVDLCEFCARIIKKFSKAFSTFETIQIEINYCLEVIHHKIQDGKRNNSSSSEPIETYGGRRMTKNYAGKSDGIFVFVDELRREISNKCLKLKTNLEAKEGKLDREDVIPKGADIEDEASSSNDFLITDELDPDPPSPPSMSLNQFISHSSSESDAGLLEDNEYIPNKSEEDEDEEEIEADLSDFETPTSSPDPLLTSAEPDESISSSSINKPETTSIASTFAMISRAIASSSRSGDSVGHSRTTTFHIYDSKTGRYKCKRCDKSYKSSSSCWEHYESNHNNRTHTCQICNVAVYRRKQSLRDHEKHCLQKKQRQQERLASEEAEDEVEEMEVMIKTEASKEINHYRQRPKKYNKIQGCTFNPETRKWVCQVCLKEFSIKSSFSQHYNTDHLKIRHKCELCEETFTQQAHLRKHWERKHGIISKPSTPPPKPKCRFNPETKKFKCLACPKEFTSKTNANSHFKNFHRQRQQQQQQSFKCDICKVAEFKFEAYLNKHRLGCQDSLDKRQAIEKKKEEDPSYKFSCPTCGKKFRERCYVQKHEKSVHQLQQLEGEHECEICQRRFKASGTLKEHKKTIHFGKRYCCKICGREYVSRRCNQRHELECAKKNPDHPSLTQEEEECQDIIQKKAPRRKLDVSMNPETGTFDCPFPSCQKSFKSAAHARIHHGLAHAKDKSHLCDLCGLSFLNNFTLAVHKKRCNGEGRKKQIPHKRIAFLKAREERRLEDQKKRDEDPEKYKFPCGTCGFKFSQLYNLKAHQKTVHQNLKDFQCEICEKKFKFKTSLRKHKEIIHFGKVQYRCQFCNKEYRWKKDGHKKHEVKCRKKNSAEAVTAAAAE